ncbi:type II toxin-antitoxin system VapC family toxin [Klenkia sp. PcliD-1-E]|uniref:type II toxin-antitoxin system VapC family toxin n=1 Tax=Klenkia sp. PcliD-1-E TaxID=2954492 RepID=UPI0020976F81|nr:type II toxin-antitoxin system VapC family toxin [Klenkia sp. PcliD-1-E]MCO7219628.1 type II toxin-antitoxin system VapC family toxin [Klenkia sp. PcliD-1-E]
MILVDTSVWIDHLHESEPALVDALASDEVGQHPLVVEELAMGRLADRDAVLVELERLRAFPVLSHAEVILLTTSNRLGGRGLSAVDAHLLGSVRLVPGSLLWTRDRRLRDAALDLGQPVVDD